MEKRGNTVQVLMVIILILVIFTLLLMFILKKGDIFAGLK